VTADGNYLIVGSHMGKFLATYDLRTDQLVWEMPFDRNVQTFTAETASDGSTARVFLNMRFPGFSIIDFATHKETARVMFPHPGGPSDGDTAMGREGGGYFVPPGKGSSHGINIAPDGKTMWLDAMGYDTPWFNNVYAYSLPGLKLLGHVHLSDVDGLGKPVGPHGQGHWQCFSPDGRMLYVVSAGLDWLHVVDVKAMKEVARVPVGANPLHVEMVVPK
jgi:YVTN family beta-propeller protein